MSVDKLTYTRYKTTKNGVWGEGLDKFIYMEVKFSVPCRPPLPCVRMKMEQPLIQSHMYILSV